MEYKLKHHHGIHDLEKHHGMKIIIFLAAALLTQVCSCCPLMCSPFCRRGHPHFPHWVSPGDVIFSDVIFSPVDCNSV